MLESVRLLIAQVDYPVDQSDEEDAANILPIVTGSRLLTKNEPQVSVTGGNIRVSFY